MHTVVLGTRYIYDVQFEKASRSLRDKEILNTLLSLKKQRHSCLVIGEHRKFSI